VKATTNAGFPSTLHNGVEIPNRHPRRQGRLARGYLRAGDRDSASSAVRNSL